jgi:NTP pyrophosphatase (non-canonical NTP hydrolase)
MAQIDIERSARFRDLDEEIQRARAKFPRADHLIAALAEEVGECAQAYLQGRASDARAEALQVACVAMRIVEEGDAEFEASLS